MDALPFGQVDQGIILAPLHTRQEGAGRLRRFLGRPVGVLHGGARAVVDSGGAARPRRAHGRPTVFQQSYAIIIYTY